MPAIFPLNVGKVIVIEDEDIQGMVSISGGENINRAIITGVDLGRVVNAQFQETMGNTTFGYSFGERRGGIKVAGVAFSLCGDSNGEKTGMEEVLEYFDRNKFGTSGEPQTVIFGSGSQSGIYIGHLTECQISVQRPELRLANYSLSFVSLPRTP